jgi:hypothetical protein
MSNLNEKTKAEIAARHAKAMARYNARVKAYNRSLELAAKEAAIVKELIEIRERESKNNA